VAGRSKKYVVLAPGKEDRDDVAKRLAVSFAVPIEEIVRAMPPGKVQVAERHGVEPESRGP
jgi:hypothetical protein